MNHIPIELCERKNYNRTRKILKKEFVRRDLIQPFENFIKSVKQANDGRKESVKSKNKLSFEVDKKS